MKKILFLFAIVQMSLQACDKSKPPNQDNINAAVKHFYQQLHEDELPLCAHIRD